MPAWVTASSDTRSLPALAGPDAALIWRGGSASAGPSLPLAGDLLGALLVWLRSEGIGRVTVASNGTPGLCRRGIRAERHPCFGEALSSACHGLGGILLVLGGDRLQSHPLSSLTGIPRGAAGTVLLCADPFDPAPLHVVTAPDGIIERAGDRGAAPVTNLADSGAWLVTPAFAAACRGAVSPGDALLGLIASGARVAGEIAHGYTRCLESREGFLVACHELLAGRVPAAAVEPPPPDGILVEEGSSVGRGTVLCGTAWIRAGSSAGSGCLLENCVLLEGSMVGDGCRLRNALVGRGARIPPGTVDFDKYLKIRERNNP